MAQNSETPVKKTAHPAKKKNFKKKFNKKFHKKTSDASKTSFIDTFGEDTASKLKQLIERNLKQKIKDAQNDPKVKAASKKFTEEV